MNLAYNLGIRSPPAWHGKLPHILLSNKVYLVGIQISTTMQDDILVYEMLVPLQTGGVSKVGW